jgi:succinoglycan biosynthesis protein ExoV
MLYYCKTPCGNFGDDLNPWLWPRLAPEVCNEKDNKLFVGIGTILNHKIPHAPFKVVFGSGSSDAGPKFTIDRRWKISCVRGPLTASRFQLDPSLAVVDPAILVRQFADAFFRPKKYRVSFMPHLQSLPFADWPTLCMKIGWHCIDPTSGVDKILQELSATELLLAEAMHGAIVADALRVPWIPVRIYGKFNVFKWQDWSKSIRVPLEIKDVPPIYTAPPKGSKRVGNLIKQTVARAGIGRANWRRLGVRRSAPDEIDRSLDTLQKIATTSTAFLSDDGLLVQLEARLMEKLSVVRADWQKHTIAS